MVRNIHGRGVRWLIAYPRSNRWNDRSLRSSGATNSRTRSFLMHQIVSAPVDTSRRWWVLAIVVAAQFMFGVDAFIVNVAIPTIAVELDASTAQVEAVIAIYLIAYATLVVTGGRLGDIYGTRNVFHRGRARLHRHLAVVRAGAIRTRTDRGAAGAGRDRGIDGAAGAGHHSSVVRGCLARPRLRHLRHRARPGGRSRLPARRRAGDVGSGGARLAHGVFRQRAVRRSSSSPRP